MLKIPNKTEYVINTLMKNGYEAFIVGGCVRDMLLGKSPYDYDVTTSATPEITMSLFEKTVPTGIKHGTVTVIVENEPIEVTTFRTESGYNDNRHPENVTFVSSLKEDLARRDFTVNAMAFNNAIGLQDFFEGKKDLENKILRAVGNPQIRFTEDALRILRLFRFASVLNFSIEEETLKSAILLSRNLENISRERIAIELRKAVLGDNFSVFKPLISAGGLSFLGVTQNPDFHILKNCRKNEKLALFSFFYLSDCDVLKVPQNLKLSNEYKTYFEKMYELCKLKFPETKSEIKEMLKISAVDIFKDYLSLKDALGISVENQNIMLTEIIENKEPFLISHLCISGKDLNKFGINGVKVGETLETIRKMVLENPDLNTKENLIKIIENI